MSNALKLHQTKSVFICRECERWVETMLM